jgi:hypothetical protein
MRRMRGEAQPERASSVQDWGLIVVFKMVGYAAGGVLLALFVWRKIARLRRSDASVAVTPVTERWLAEQRGLPSDY